MPNRILRDGIITSSRVNALSLGAELLYRRLLSVVDDYGRYFGHPATVRTGAWPTCPDKHSDDNVRKWLGELTSGARPLLVTYEVEGVPYFYLDGFGQRVQAASKFPAPPKSGGGPNGTEPSHRESTVENGESTVENRGFTGKNGGARSHKKNVRERAPLQTVTNRFQRLRARAFEVGVEDEDVMRSAAAAILPTMQEGTTGEVSPSPQKNEHVKKPPESATVSVRTSSSEVGSSGELPGDETFSAVRAILDALANEVKLPRADDGIVERVLDVCRGASGALIQEIIRELYHRGKFREMRSWGFMPIVLKPWFRERAS